MHRDKSVLFVTLHRPDRSPSQRFRFEQYISHLEKNGFRCEHLFLLDENDDKTLYSPGKYAGKLRIVIKSILKLKKAGSNAYDIVYVQREAFMLGSTYFEKRFSRRSKLIFDFDDSIWLQNVSEANRKLVFLKNPNKTAALIKLADLVLAGNDYLADYARQYNRNVEIVPTTIDTEEYRRKPKQIPLGVVCIGWSGSTTTIQHFEHAIPALTEIKKKFGDRVSIQVIGDKNYRNPNLGIVGKAWNKDTEVTDLSAFDIGIMPLPDDEWARGKCGLKGLQYMALGIPTIMSPVGVNSQIIEDGKNGLLAADTAEWTSKLTELIESQELRAALGNAGRKTVEHQYSVLAWRDKYVELFNSLI